METNPVQFIKLIRESFNGSEIVFTQGSCYQLYKILKEVFPDAEAYYNSDHVITKIEDKYYDINGEVKKDNHLPMKDHYPNSGVMECKYAFKHT